MTPLGPSHLVAAKSRLVSLCRLPSGRSSRPRPVGAVLGGQPGAEVALTGGGKLEAAGGEPVQQCGRGSDVVLDGCCLSVGGVSSVVAPAQPVKCVPDRVSLQQLPFVGVGAFGDGAGDPLLEADQVFVAGWQGCGGDRTLRRCLTGLLSGSSSRAAWVSARCPAASSPKIAVAVSLFSQTSTVSGRSWSV